jgi:hypothetical protein
MEDAFCVHPNFMEHYVQAADRAEAPNRLPVRIATMVRPAITLDDGGRKELAWLHTCLPLRGAPEFDGLPLFPLKSRNDATL